MTPSLPYTCPFEFKTHSKGKPGKSWGQESTQGHSTNWSQFSCVVFIIPVGQPVGIKTGAFDSVLSH